MLNNFPQEVFVAACDVQVGSKLTAAEDLSHFSKFQCQPAQLFIMTRRYSIWVLIQHITETIKTNASIESLIKILRRVFQNVFENL